MASPLRRYSLDEIDRMRLLTTRLICAEERPYFSWQNRQLVFGLDRSSEQIKLEAEDRLRTYLLAGVAPDELRTKLVGLLARRKESCIKSFEEFAATDAECQAQSLRSIFRVVRHSDRLYRKYIIDVLDGYIYTTMIGCDPQQETLAS